MISTANLQDKVNELLTIIHSKRMSTVSKMRLSVLLSKNPYLYQSHGHTRAEDLIDALLAARISSSDETIFGNDFFEPLALWAAQEAQIPGRSVQVSDAAGADITISDDKFHFAIAVKSGKNIFNSQSNQGQSSEFSANRSRMKKLGKTFLPLIGYGYGRKKHSPEAAIDKKAGQDFWQLLTGESDFYLRISDAIAACAIGNKKIYQKVYELRRSTLIKEFFAEYTDTSGQIDWKKLVVMNSATVKPHKLKPPPKTSKKTEISTV